MVGSIGNTIAITQPENRMSIQVLQKLGLKFERMINLGKLI